MQANSESIRGPRPQKVLWMWTGVSAVIHAVLVAALCGVSYLGFAKREAASRAKLATEEIATKKAEADEAAKAGAAAPAGATPASAANTPKAAAKPEIPTEKMASTEKAPATPAPAPTAPQDAPPIQAEKVLGIDKTAKPGEVLKSPFSGSSDDILKDLK